MQFIIALHDHTGKIIKVWLKKLGDVEVFLILHIFVRTSQQYLVPDDKIDRINQLRVISFLSTVASISDSVCWSDARPQPHPK